MAVSGGGFGWHSVMVMALCRPPFANHSNGGGDAGDGDARPPPTPCLYTRRSDPKRPPAHAHASRHTPHTPSTPPGGEGGAAGRGEALGWAAKEGSVATRGEGGRRLRGGTPAHLTPEWSIFRLGGPLQDRGARGLVPAIDRLQEKLRLKLLVSALPPTPIRKPSITPTPPGTFISRPHLK